MATNLAINNDLLTSALKISGLKTKKETVNLALEEFIQRRKRKEAIVHTLFNILDREEELLIGPVRQELLSTAT